MLDGETLVNDGQLGFTSISNFPRSSPDFGSASSIVVADFDKDGQGDLARSRGSSLQVLLNKQLGHFDVAWSLLLADGKIFDIADLDGDGDLDAVGGGRFASPHKVVFNRGDGIILDERTVPQLAELASLVAVDIDEDGHTDLLAASLYQRHVSIVWGGPGRAFSQEQRIPLSGSPLQAAAADFDGDGLKDLLIAMDGPGLSDPDQLVLLWNLRDGRFAEPVNINSVRGFSALAIADLDGDQRPDVVVTTRRVTNDPRVTILWNAGNRSFANPVELATRGVGGNVVAADLDGDSRLDLAVATSQGPDLYFNGGQRTWDSYRPIVAKGGTARLVAADLNRDGDVDLAFSSYDSQTNAVVVLANNGRGDFSSASTLAAPGQPRHLDAGDIDGDGDVDLLVGVADQVYVLRNTLPPTVNHRLFLVRGQEVTELDFLSRQVLWQNPAEQLDVNGDGIVAPLDVLIIVNEINARGSRVLVASPGNTAPPYLDPSGDGNVSPIDALLIVNHLNRRATGEGEASTELAGPMPLSESLGFTGHSGRFADRVNHANRPQRVFRDDSEWTIADFSSGQKDPIGRRAALDRDRENDAEDDLSTLEAFFEQLGLLDDLDEPSSSQPYTLAW